MFSHWWPTSWGFVSLVKNYPPAVKPIWSSVGSTSPFPLNLVFGRAANKKTGFPGVMSQTWRSGPLNPNAHTSSLTHTMRLTQGFWTACYNSMDWFNFFRPRSQNNTPIPIYTHCCWCLMILLPLLALQRSAPNGIPFQDMGNKISIDII